MAAAMEVDKDRKFETYVNTNIRNVNFELTKLRLHFGLETKGPEDFKEKFENEDGIVDFANSTNNINGISDTYKINFYLNYKQIGYTVIVITDFKLRKYGVDYPSRFRLFIDQTDIDVEYRGYGFAKCFTYLHVSLIRLLKSNRIPCDIVSWDQRRLDSPPRNRYRNYGFESHDEQPGKAEDDETDDHIRIYKPGETDNDNYDDINNILLFENVEVAYTTLRMKLGLGLGLGLPLDRKGSSKYNYYSKYMKYKLKYIQLKKLIGINT